MQDYWRQLSASSSVVACRTANPTSFLRPVVGSASLLSATANFWRLAILIQFHWKYKRESFFQLPCLPPGLHLAAQTAQVDPSPASRTVGDCTQRLHCWLLFTTRCLHPCRLWRLTLLRHSNYCSGYVLLVAPALTTGGGACRLVVVRLCTVGAGNANPCCGSAAWFGRSAAAAFPSSTATIVRDAQNACTGSYVQVASVVMRSELWLTLV